MRLRVMIVAPSLGEYERAAAPVRAAGHEVRSPYLYGVELDPQRMSTEDMRDLADHVLSDIGQCDVLVSVHNRSTSPGTPAWAGAAAGRGKPVIVVGAYDDLFLYASPVKAVEVDDLADTLKKLVSRLSSLQLAREQIKLNLGRTGLDPVTLQPRTGDSDGADNRKTNDGPEGQPAGGAPGGA